MVMFTGKLTAKAMGKKSPGLACGAEIFIAAGTAIYEALAARTAKINLLEGSWVTKLLSIAIQEPLIKGIAIANRNGNQPKEKNALSLRPLLMPISKRNMAKNPLNKSLVNGLMPSACFALATKPMSKLPKIKSTLPLVMECLKTVDFFMFEDSDLL